MFCLFLDNNSFLYCSCPVLPIIGLMLLSSKAIPEVSLQTSTKYEVRSTKRKRPALRLRESGHRQRHSLKKRQKDEKIERAREEGGLGNRGRAGSGSGHGHCGQVGRGGELGAAAQPLSSPILLSLWQ